MLQIGMVIDGYVLEKLLGEGAAGEVWRARGPDGADVALKVLSPSHTHRADYRRSFRREVEAMARLRHPNIVTILDMGFEGGRSPRPWLAMELLHGPLRRGSVQAFAALRRVLADVLDGLAHAHARNILHRDLKPGNVLEQHHGDEVIYQLADFGIAHPMGVMAAENSAEVSLRAAGTPMYMAPELVTGEWRNWGPWTDLYALGILAWELATGSPPFVADNAIDIGRMQLEREPGTFRPRFEVPEGFEDWLRRLLRKKPYTRYEKAADAGWRLAQFPQVARPGEIPTRRIAQKTLTFLDIPTKVLQEISGPDLWSPTADELVFTTRYPDVPPVPASWQAPDDRSRSGLSLLGLRATPLVGRTSQRNQLWRILQQTRADKAPRFALIEAPVGRGATTLARWFAYRADELGAARSLWIDPGRDGLRRALSMMIGGQGMSKRQLRQRVFELTTIFGRPEAAEIVADGVADLLTREGEGGVFDRMFRSGSDERFMALTRLLRTAARSRPLLVVFDDLHQSHESALLVDFLMRDRRRIDNIVIVATVDEHWRSTAQRDFGELLERSTTHVTSLPPNEPQSAQAVITSLVPLDASTAEAISESVGGRVLDAVAMVFHLTESGRLLLSDGTLSLVREQLEPLNLEEIWLRRFASAADSRGDAADGATTAFDLAAVLGDHFAMQDWRAAVVAAQDLEPEFLDDLLDDAVERGLMRRRGEAVAFDHRSARDALMISLEHDTERYRALHSHVADTSRDSDMAPLMMIEYLRRAGRSEEALDVALDGMAHHYNDGSILLADIAAELLVAVDADPSDSRWGEIAASQAAHFLYGGDLEMTEEVLQRLERGIERYGWEEHRAGLEMWRGEFAMRRGNFEEAWSRMRDAESIAAESGDRRLRAQMARHTLELAGLLGKIEEAEQVAAVALADIDALGFERLRASTEYAFGAAYFYSNRHEQAGEWYERALANFRKFGDRTGIASSLVGLGQVAAATGDYPEGIRLVGEGVAAFETLGSIHAGLAKLALMTYRVFARDVTIEEDDIRDVQRQLRESNNPRYLAYGCLLGIGWAGLVGKLDAFDEFVVELQEGFEAYVLGDPDVPALLSIGAEGWRSRGDEERARLCEQLKP